MSNDELFEVPVQLSPREQWIREHGVLFDKDPDQENPEPWAAWVGSGRIIKKSGVNLEGRGLYFRGATREEAFTRLAGALIRDHGVKHWAEGGAK